MHPSEELCPRCKDSAGLDPNQDMSKPAEELNFCQLCGGGEMLSDAVERLATRFVDRGIEYDDPLYKLIRRHVLSLHEKTKE